MRLKILVVKNIVNDDRVLYFLHMHSFICSFARSVQFTHMSRFLTKNSIGKFIIIAWITRGQVQFSEKLEISFHSMFKLNTLTFNILYLNTALYYTHTVCLATNCEHIPKCNFYISRKCIRPLQLYLSEYISN